MNETRLKYVLVYLSVAVMLFGLIAIGGNVATGRFEREQLPLVGFVVLLPFMTHRMAFHNKMGWVGVMAIVLSLLSAVLVLLG